MSLFREGSDLQFVESIVTCIEPKESITVSSFSRLPVHNFRMCINKVARQYGMLFKTRYSKDLETLKVERIR